MILLNLDLNQTVLNFPSDFQRPKFIQKTLFHTKLPNLTKDGVNGLIYSIPYSRLDLLCRNSPDGANFLKNEITDSSGRFSKSQTLFKKILFYTKIPNLTKD